MADIRYLIFINDYPIKNLENVEIITFTELKTLGKDLYIVMTKLFKLNGLRAGKQITFSLDPAIKSYVASAICFFSLGNQDSHTTATHSHKLERLIGQKGEVL